MGRSRKPSAKRADSDSDLDYPSNSVLFLSSSDDEEANKDLSLEIVERAMAKDAKRKKEKSEVVLVNFASTEDLELNIGSTEEKKIRRKIKRKKKIENQVKVEIVEDTGAEPSKEEEQAGTADSVVTEVNEVPIPDNVVMRKLLRGPRYFDPEEKDSIVCFNCGEEGHAAVNCTKERKQRPCFICGMLGHSPKHCTQKQDCYICKKRGHIAKKCPDKNIRVPEDSMLCLRCGDLGHELLQCKNDYAPCDLKEIQCYMCKNYGHFCCVDFKDDGPNEMFCYNCAQPGHTGHGCAKVRGGNGDLVDAGPSEVCYKCGEEGHFARGCTNKFKFDQWNDGSATARKPFKEHKKKDFMVSHSAPHDYRKVHKKKKRLDDDDRWDMTNSDLVDARPLEVCYKCGEEGHFARRCTNKIKSDQWNGGSAVDARPLEVCYKCGEEGHFARRCTNKIESDQWNGGSAKPFRALKEHKKKDLICSQSAPRDDGKILKKKKMFDSDDRWNMTSGKSRIKGGWIVDDLDDFPRTKQRPINWNSPSTPDKRSSHKVFVAESNGIYSTPRTPFWKRKSIARTPKSSASRYHNQHYNYTLSSYYNSHDDYF